MSLSVAENEIKQVYMRDNGDAINALLSHANQFFFITSCSEWAFFASARPEAIYTNLIRFFPGSEEMNIGIVKIFLHFHKGVVFSFRYLTQQISIHLSPEFFFFTALLLSPRDLDMIMWGAFGWRSIHMLSLNCAENCYFLWMCQSLGIVNFVRCSRRLPGFIIP